MKKITYSLEVITQKVGLQKNEVIRYVEEKVVVPYDYENLLFDEEDFGRLVLISELKRNCEPNDESLHIILHLLDQIHFLQKMVKVNSD